MKLLKHDDLFRFYHRSLQLDVDFFDDEGVMIDFLEDVSNQDQKFYYVVFRYIYLKLSQTSIWYSMMETVENSPWHRESNVAIHTDMVLNEFLIKHHPYTWTIHHLKVAIALLFHDTGKPQCMQYDFKTDRGVYKKFHGHETVSANIYCDFIYSNIEDEVIDMYNISQYTYDIMWLITYHLPYERKDITRLNKTCQSIFGDDWKLFGDMVMSDAKGRISDDHSSKIEKVGDWIQKFENAYIKLINDINRYNTVYILIGCSGSGKSTFCAMTDAIVYSWDNIRLQQYTPSDFKGNAVELYTYCHDQSKNDDKFVNICNNMFIDIMKQAKKQSRDVIVDNMNLSNKRRLMFESTALQYGFKVQYVLFTNTLDTIMQRNAVRRYVDRDVPRTVVTNMYFDTSVPSIDDNVSLVLYQPQ